VYLTLPGCASLFTFNLRERRSPGNSSIHGKTQVEGRPPFRLYVMDQRRSTAWVSEQVLEWRSIVVHVHCFEYGYETQNRKLWEAEAAEKQGTEVGKEN